MAGVIGENDAEKSRRNNPLSNYSLKSYRTSIPPVDFRNYLTGGAGPTSRPLSNRIISSGMKRTRSRFAETLPKRVVGLLFDSFQVLPVWISSQFQVISWSVVDANSRKRLYFFLSGILNRIAEVGKSISRYSFLRLFFRSIYGVDFLPLLLQRNAKYGNLLFHLYQIRY